MTVKRPATTPLFSPYPPVTRRPGWRDNLNCDGNLSYITRQRILEEAIHELDKQNQILSARALLLYVNETIETVTNEIVSRRVKGVVARLLGDASQALEAGSTDLMGKILKIALQYAQGAQRADPMTLIHRPGPRRLC